MEISSITTSITNFLKSLNYKKIAIIAGVGIATYVIANKVAKTLKEQREDQEQRKSVEKSFDNIIDLLIVNGNEKLVMEGVAIRLEYGETLDFSVYVKQALELVNKVMANFDSLDKVTKELKKENVAVEIIKETSEPVPVI